MRWTKPEAIPLFRQNNHKAHFKHFHFSYVDWVQTKLFLSSRCGFPLPYLNT